MPNEEEAKVDAFGSDVKVETQSQTETEEKKGDEGKGQDDKELTKIKEHPLYKELEKSHSDAIKKIDDYGTNLSNQGKIIKELKDFKENIEKNGGGKKEDEALFKDVKTSKDLTKEEREEMTDTEIKQFDQIAELKNAINKMAGESKKAQKEEEKPSGTVDPEKVENLNSEASSIAKEIAGGDIEMANKIIFEFNQFAGNETLTKTQLKERMEKASKLVEGFKPKKEASSVVTKKAVGGEGNGEKDPFGIDNIVEEASKGQKGSYSL